MCSKIAAFLGSEPGSKPSAFETPSGFYALSTELAKDYIATKPELVAQVGPLDSISSWTCVETGDGNINFVYIVKGPSGAMVLKQGLPYVRLVGESWPLTQVTT